MNIRLCVKGSDCEYRLRPIEGASGIFREFLCHRDFGKPGGRYNKGVFSKCPYVVLKPHAEFLNGFGKSVGGHLEDRLSGLSESLLWPVVANACLSETNVIWSWAMDYASRSIAFRVDERNGRLWMLKKARVI